jgi:hypothetical protein
MQNSKGLSRREFLKTLAAGSAGAAMAAAGVPMVSGAEHAAAPRAQGGDVVLQVAGWPYTPLPEAEPEGGFTPYHEALMVWMEQNPGVRLENIEVGIWDTAALQTAIAGGTAPVYFSTGVIGSWTAAGMQAAYVQGLVAEITDQWNAYGLGDKLSDLVKAGRVYYTLGDRIFGVVNEIATGNGIYFRRDLLAEAGLEEPTVEWTYEDVRELARALTADPRKGIAMQGWGLGWQLQSELMGERFLLNYLPDPSSGWNWRWDYSTFEDHMVATIERHRAMMFEDGSILMDSTFGDGQVQEQFVNGNAAMATMPSQFYTRVGDGTITSLLATPMGVPTQDLVGFLPHPRGANGAFSTASRPIIPPIGLNPDATEAQKDAAVNLYTYMDVEDGFDFQRKARFDATGELKEAFAVYPFPRAKTTIDGVEGTPVDAWGQAFVDVIDYIAQVAGGFPEAGNFLPPEENIGPTMSAWADAQSSLGFEPGDLDIRAVLQTAQQTLNEQAAGFSSSIPDDVFVEGASAYYAAHDAFWAENFPTFHEGVFRNWYETVIAPALGM